VFDVTNDLVTCIQADPLIEIADMILEHASRDFVSLGDGIVTFHCTNGDLTYGLTEHDDLRECWLGVRSGVSDEDLHAAE
jgi:hypothetical protein